MNQTNQIRYSKEYSNKHLYKEKKEMVNYLLKKIDRYLVIEGRVLDVGCGIGVLGGEIKEKCGGEVYGLDINKVAVKKATKLGVKAQVFDIEKKWPFPKNFFDQVYIIQTIEHVVNTDNLVIEARRVLKKGGKLIVTTPNLASWFNRFLFIFGFQPFFTEVSIKDKTFGIKFTRLMTSHRDTLGHLRVFTLKALIDLIEYYKLKIYFTAGNEVAYFPRFMKPLDYLFSKFPGLASDLLVVAEK